MEHMSPLPPKKGRDPLGGAVQVGTLLNSLGHCVVGDNHFLFFGENKIKKCNLEELSKMLIRVIPPQWDVSQF